MSTSSGLATSTGEASSFAFTIAGNFALNIDVRRLFPGDLVVLARDQEMLPKLHFTDPHDGLRRPVRYSHLADGSLVTLIQVHPANDSYWYVLAGDRLGWLHDSWFSHVGRQGELLSVDR